jgi:Protein of unknown function (DUF2934)
MVMNGLEEKVRQRAYELWEKKRPEGGSEMDFWLQAEREIAEGGNAPEPPQDRLE